MTTHPQSGSTNWPPRMTPPPGCPAHTPAANTNDDNALYGTLFENDPGALYERLRRRYGPVAPVRLDADVPAWIVLGYAENLQVLHDPRGFTRDSRAWRDLAEGRIPPDWPLRPVLQPQPSALHRDGEEHRKFRGAITASLDRLDRRAVRRYVQYTADQLIDTFAEAGRVDLLSQYARQIPLLVMIGVFGLPADQGPRLAEATTRMLDGSGAAEAFAFLRATLADAIAAKRLSPATTSSPG
jgi:cytochrome P450